LARLARVRKVRVTKLRNNEAMNDDSKTLLVQIGKAQIDGMT
jgi:hypothetical protein